MQTKEKPIAINHERENWRDEVTDAAERLRMPMEHSFSYKLIDGKLYSEFGKSIDVVVANGIADIRPKVALQPDLQFELDRRLLDQEELEEVKTLQPGEKLVTILPIPDAVRNGTTTIDGYDRQRMRALVRVSEHTLDGSFTIACFSLDKSDYGGLQAAAQTVEHTIADGLGSEAIMAQRQRVGGETSAKEMIDTMRAAYDIQLAKTYGGLWYAGRPHQSSETALEFVLNQPDLVTQHTKIMRDLGVRFSGVELTLKQHEARYNFAAVLDDRLNKKEVGAHSFESSGTQARVDGKSFDGDCPTTTAQQAVQLGFKTETLMCVTCPFCSNTVDAKKTAHGIQCPDCLTERRNNGDVVNHRTTKQQLAKTAVKKVIKKNNPNREKYTFKHVIQVGGALLQAIKNGEIIAQGRAAERLKASIARND